MKLNKLILENFRCFEHLELDLHPQLTVLIAENGGGKTAVLDAARIALWPFVKGFDLGSQTGKGASIQISDVRLVEQILSDGKKSGTMTQIKPCEIMAHGKIINNNPIEKWGQTRKSTKINTNTIPDENTKNITKHANYLNEEVGGEEYNGLNLPVVIYLGVSRLLQEGRFTSVAKDLVLNLRDQFRTSGYLDCLSYYSSFKAFVLWYGWIYRSYNEEKMEAHEKGEKLSVSGEIFYDMIKSIQSAIDLILKEGTGWHSLQYRSSQNKQLVMRHDENGFIPVEMLSDGIRNTIAMVADIAYRACKLNPHLGENAAKETDGIVLIDEVDMHLHPKWQQTILKSLTDAFPKIQFIVTTHSPQVLSTVRRENIRVLPEGKMPLAMTYGEPSGYVMHGVMGVDPQPPVSEKADLQRLTELVNREEYEIEHTIDLLEKLKNTLGTHPQLQRLERSIQRHQMLKGMAKAKP